MTGGKRDRSAPPISGSQKSALIFIIYFFVFWCCCVISVFLGADTCVCRHDVNTLTALHCMLLMIVSTYAHARRIFRLFSDSSVSI